MRHLPPYHDGRELSFLRGVCVYVLTCVRVQWIQGCPTENGAQRRACRCAATLDRQGGSALFMVAGYAVVKTTW